MHAISAAWLQGVLKMDEINETQAGSRLQRGSGRMQRTVSARI